MYSVNSSFGAGLHYMPYFGGKKFRMNNNCKELRIKKRNMKSWNPGILELQAEFWISGQDSGFGESMITSEAWMTNSAQTMPLHWRGIKVKWTLSKTCIVQKWALSEQSLIQPRNNTELWGGGLSKPRRSRSWGSSNLCLKQEAWEIISSSITSQNLLMKSQNHTKKI